jgi:hypothetical protein
MFLRDRVGISDTDAHSHTPVVLLSFAHLLALRIEEVVPRRA